MFTLFRIATLEKWFFILADCTRRLQINFICNEVNDYNDYAKLGQSGCGTLWAYPFFLSFYIIILLILNLLVGILIKMSGNIRKLEKSSINVDHLDEIKKLWAEFDHNGGGYLDYKDFWAFSAKIAKIFGMKVEELLDFETKKKFLMLLNILLYENTHNNNIFCLKFHEVLIALSKIALMVKFHVST